MLIYTQYIQPSSLPPLSTTPPKKKPLQNFAKLTFFPMGRKCSHCGYIGHNSRTCSTLKCSISGSNFIGGLKLFGVQLDIANSSSSSSSSSSFSSHNLKKSFSLDCLSLTNSHIGHSHLSSSLSPSPSINESCEKSTTSINNNGYLSDGIGVGCVGERKKGM